MKLRRDLGLSARALSAYTAAMVLTPNPPRGLDPRVARVLAVAVLCLGVAIGIWGALQSGPPTHRTATAKQGNVEKKVTEPATVDDVSQADENFDVSGDVSSVDVSEGDYVYADETVARMDTYSADTYMYEDSLYLADERARARLGRVLPTDLSSPPRQELATVEQEVATDPQTAAVQAQASLAALQAQDQATLQEAEPAVSQAEQTLATDTGTLTTAKASMGQDQVALETAQEQFADSGCPKPPPGSTADCTSLESAVTKAQSAVTSDEGTVNTDQSNVESDQQSVQDVQTNLLVTGLNDQSLLTQATAKSTTAALALTVADASDAKRAGGCSAVPSATWTWSRRPMPKGSPKPKRRSSPRRTT